MTGVGFMAETRRRHFVEGGGVGAIARDLQLSRPTVRKALTALDETTYKRRKQACPVLGGFQSQLEHWLDVESRLPRRQRRTAQRPFEGLQAEGYRGSYDPPLPVRAGGLLLVNVVSVQRHAQRLGSGICVLSLGGRLLVLQRRQFLVQPCA